MRGDRFCKFQPFSHCYVAEHLQCDFSSLYGSLVICIMPTSFAGMRKVKKPDDQGCRVSGEILYTRRIKHKSGEGSLEHEPGA